MSPPDPSAAALARLRSDYQASGLRRADLPADPVDLRRTWLADASAAGLAEANAMVVSTVDPDGLPSARTVLCKGADERGFGFFTNYTSRKGTAIAANPSVALLFPWRSLSRQVVVTGHAERVPTSESEAYFASRPRSAALEARVADVAAAYAGAVVPCPPGWGGFVVCTRTVEFWQGRNDRLHDRLRYTSAAPPTILGRSRLRRRSSRGGWDVERLSP